MQIQYSSDTVQSEGVQVQTMGFDATKQAKMFHMMSNSLYRNKPMAILRELASNAYDAHKDAGVDAPFSITIPTVESPVLVVQDCGTGLTLDKAKKTILQFLGSTKDDSEDFIGGWGIGAKSPLSYANDYEVILRKDGYQWNVSVWKGDFGIPDWAVTWEGPIPEGKRVAGPIAGNGVTFRVPVKIQDIRLWQEAITLYMRWTNYNAVAYGGKGAVTLPCDYAYTQDVEYKGITFTAASRLGSGRGGFKLVYGGMSYDMLECLDKASDEYKVLALLVNRRRADWEFAVIVNTPNALNFTMSREDIEHTEKSTRFVSTVVEYLRMTVGHGAESENFTNWQDLVDAKTAYETEVQAKAGDALCVPLMEAVTRLSRKFYMRGYGSRVGAYRATSTLYELAVSAFQELPSMQYGVTVYRRLTSRQLRTLSAGITWAVEKEEGETPEETVAKLRDELGLPEGDIFVIPSDEELKKAQRRERAKEYARTRNTVSVPVTTCTRTREKIRLTRDAKLVVVDVPYDAGKLDLLVSLGVLPRCIWPSKHLLKVDLTQFPRITRLSECLEKADAALEQFNKDAEISKEQLETLHQLERSLEKVSGYKLWEFDKVRSAYRSHSREVGLLTARATQAHELCEKFQIKRPKRQKSKEAHSFIATLEKFLKTLEALETSVRYSDLEDLVHDLTDNNPKALAEVKRLKLQDWI